jgi:hypothetical protein
VDWISLTLNLLRKFAWSLVSSLWAPIKGWLERRRFHKERSRRIRAEIKNKGYANEREITSRLRKELRDKEEARLSERARIERIKRMGGRIGAIGLLLFLPLVSSCKHESPTFYFDLPPEPRLCALGEDFTPENWCIRDCSNLPIPSLEALECWVDRDTAKQAHLERALGLLKSVQEEMNK